MAYNDTEDSKGRQAHPIVTNESEDGSGTAHALVSDSSGYLKVKDVYRGMVYLGTVTTATDSTHFKATGLAGFSDGYFIGWYVYPVWDAAGAGGAPQGEAQLVSAYTSATGTFTHGAFTAALALTDKVLLIHPYLKTAGAASGITEAQVNAQVDGALNTIIPAAPTAGSLNDILSKASGGNTFNKSTDSLESLGEKTAALKSGQTHFKDQWCATPIASLAIPAVAADLTFASVVFPASFLPAGAAIQAIYLILKWRKQVDSSTSANAIAGASKTIRVMKSAASWGTDDVVGITFADNQLATGASATEGGDVIIGSADIKSEVDDVDDATYVVVSEQTNRTDAMVVDGASLTLYDVYTGLRVYYTL